MRQDTASDLHAGFRDPCQAVPAALATFLQQADQLPGLRTLRQAMREALRPWPGARLLDAGCGIGLEATRLAADYPDLQVVGMDVNADLVAAARRRAGSGHPNLTWAHADLADPALSEAAFDLVRTERVLMYFPGASFGHAVDALVRQLRPGGRLACFELDYGATILAPGADEKLDRELAEVLERSLPQPWAGRRLPGMLAERGLAEVTATPHAFAVSEPVWQKIVLGTLRTAAADGRLGRAAADQLEERAENADDSPFLAVFCGVLTTARKHGCPPRQHLGLDGAGDHGGGRRGLGGEPDLGRDAGGGAALRVVGSAAQHVELRRAAVSLRWAFVDAAQRGARSRSRSPASSSPCTPPCPPPRPAPRAACDHGAPAGRRLQSEHETSAGTVAYARCPCGAWLVLQDGQPLAATHPQPRAAVAVAGCGCGCGTTVKRYRSGANDSGSGPIRGEAGDMSITGRGL